MREKGVDVASVTELSPGLKDREVLDLALGEAAIPEPESARAARLITARGNNAQR
jgi:hypothetical protein